MKQRFRAESVVLSEQFLGQSHRILEISDSDAGLKVEKTGSVDGGEGVCVETHVRDVLCWLERSEVWKFCL